MSLCLIIIHRPFKMSSTKIESDTPYSSFCFSSAFSTRSRIMEFDEVFDRQGSGKRSGAPVFFIIWILFHFHGQLVFLIQILILKLDAVLFLWIHNKRLA